MAEDVPVDPDALREQVREKYRQVALEPEAGFHFHTGRALAHRLGYEAAAGSSASRSPVDTFAGAQGEANARTYEVYGYTFLARKPG